MVVRIKTGKSARGALSYNEQKVGVGKAELILASRFGCELEELGFTKKLDRFERLNRKSQRVTTNTLHLSLNFSPYEKLSTEKMQAIAADYMQRIGFGEQPFLVYRHDDAHHPHLHIVASIIKPNGRPINVHNLAKLKSEPARKAIEKEFDLIPAESMKREVALPLVAVGPEKAIYGQGETKRVISNIVREVVASYHFSSIDEFNAILKDYNIVADQGRQGSRMREKGGLMYSMLDEQGNKIGVPIKASSIYSSPTLAALQKKFEKEAIKKHLYTKHARDAVAKVFERAGRITAESAIRLLSKRKLSCRFIKDNNGAIQDIQVVDHFSKVVLTARDLNLSTETLQNKIIPDVHVQHLSPAKVNKTDILSGNQHQPDFSVLTQQLLRGLLTTHTGDPGSAPGVQRKKKKKRNPGL